jgi:DNA-binding beta-propeller fold protein YncE
MENMSVKVFDTRNELATSEIHLNEAESIWASTSVNDDQVAVSVSIKGKGKILFFSVSPSGIISDIQQVLDVKYPYKGIIHSNGRFYATVLNQVDVISIHGQFIETITDKSFRELWGIAVSNDHNTLYICSSNNDTVFSLNLNGKVKATFKGDELQGPLCLTIDREGYVYVCSQYTRNVHQLASDLSEGHVIISGEYVWTCAFNNTEKELCLGFGRSIKVFDIIYNM